MPKYWPVIKSFKVTHENREMDVFYPETGDRIYDEEIEATEREKTLEELKAKPPKHKATPKEREDIIGAMREIQEFTRRKKESPNRRFF